MVGMAIFTSARSCAASAGRRVADRVPRAPGVRRRDHLARDARDHQRVVQPRRCRAQQGVRDLGRGRGERCRCRRAARRDPDRVPRLAVDLLRERPGRNRDHPARARGWSPKARPRASTRIPTRSPRSSSPPGSCRSCTRCRRRPRRMDLGPDDRLDHPRRGADRGLLRRRRCGPTRPLVPLGLFRAARSPSRTPSASASAARSSAASSCSPSTCSRCWATRRSRPDSPSSRRRARPFPPQASRRRSLRGSA